MLEVETSEEPKQRAKFSYYINDGKQVKKLVLEQTMSEVLDKIEELKKKHSSFRVSDYISDIYSQ